MNKEKKYDGIYSKDNFYWGKKPSAICEKVVDIMKPSIRNKQSLLDIGCGEGRNAVYFAKKGFKVTGFDYSKPGLEKAQKYAEAEGVELEIIHADIRTYNIEKKYDVLFSTGTFHYIPDDKKEAKFLNFKEKTSQNGINVFSVFVKKPFIEVAPDHEENVYPFKSGELFSYFWDWEIIFSLEEIFDCMSGGVPHKHAVNRIIARRYNK